MHGLLRSDVESETNAHIGILVIRDVVRHFVPRHIIHRERAILPNRVPRRAVVHLHDVIHVRRQIALEPALEGQVERRGVRRIEYGARQVIVRMQGRERTTAHVHARHDVIRRRRRILRRISALRHGRRRLDVPFRIERPADGIREVFLEIHRRTTLTNEFPRDTGARPAATASNTGPRIALVHLTVAIVVETIAFFRLARQVRLALQNAHQALRRSGRTQIRLARIANEVSPGIVLVDRAIAIVIEAVALFSRRRNDRETIDLAALALKLPGRAHPEIPRSAIESGPRNVVIDRPVAIVVDVIAAFEPGHHVRNARLGAHHASLLAYLTRSALAGNAARFAIVRERLVDLQIAVVVDSVTDLERRSVGNTRIEHALVARQHLDLTSADTARRFTHVVGFAIAIVVDLIAQLLRLGFDLAHARSPCTRQITRLLTGGARPDPIGSIRPRVTLLGLSFGTWTALVHHLVAIVVLAVTNLGRRCTYGSAPAHSSGTGKSTGPTGPTFTADGTTPRRRRRRLGSGTASRLKRVNEATAKRQERGRNRRSHRSSEHEPDARASWLEDSSHIMHVSGFFPGVKQDRTSPCHHRHDAWR